MTRLNRWKEINDYVNRKGREARARGERVTQEYLQELVVLKAKQMDFPFLASSKWVHNFKRRYGWVGRKITKKTQKILTNSTEVIDQRIAGFRQEFSNVQ